MRVKLISQLGRDASVGRWEFGSSQEVKRGGMEVFWARAAAGMLTARGV